MELNNDWLPRNREARSKQTNLTDSTLEQTNMADAGLSCYNTVFIPKRTAESELPRTLPNDVVVATVDTSKIASINFRYKSDNSMVFTQKKDAANIPENVTAHTENKTFGGKNLLTGFFICLQMYYISVSNKNYLKNE